ncbi:zinc-binding alcohol dehydrogenase family protein [Rubritalea squalenifaciens DSM 18772]|uniref:Zinc-type alcohol dehydrogenase-like protein n=2 Tax=Rubritalea squalenifaciens TaxID=407226 RepID=A0A1M6IUM2_9BACT|nr:zinc-binding alcohol dehydrogenase family protein [Rubritalea squalenifaciens]SHJ38112.1 zinc-binding alcohol dehydrogenase family protein [Rubritalea squalenifaciens DSM 18772]
MMRAIQFSPSPNTELPYCADFIELPRPQASGYDILVSIEAVAMNPVDTKVRPSGTDEAKTLGYDAAGAVIETGELVDSLSVGDKVYYAGDVTRPGSNAELQLIDSRIVAKRPESLSAAEAAALPLTALTAWESLYERMGIDPDGNQAGKSIFIIGGAGGVGSIAIQLAKLAGLTVITTSSRQESSDWCQEMGADHIINHREDIQSQLSELGFPAVNYVANYFDTDAYWELTGEIIAPQGHIALIVEPSGPLYIGDPLKRKSASIHWEFMFTRSMFTTEDIQKQQQILSKVAKLVDTGKIRTTLNQVLSPISPENLMKAHQLQESSSSIGKTALQDWQ